MQPLRVLVCGSNYGRAYVEAVGAAPAAFHLAGILGLGSARSHALAGVCGVPLYRDLDAVVGDVDIACAAMGSAGADVVLRLLAKGIHVLCEHPQRPDFIVAALESATAGRACFHVNGHFALLPPASAFIERCEVLRHSADACFIDAMTTDRSLYAALDILRRCTKRFAPFGTDTCHRFAPFTAVRGTLGGIPATFQVQDSTGSGSRGLQDGGPGYLVDHRIAIGFPAGVITLASIAGPVIWNGNCGLPAGPADPMWTSVYQEPVTRLDLHRQRISANLGALRSLAESARTGTVPEEQSREHVLEVSRAWEEIATKLSH